jgi:hypothetical protein
MEPGHSDDDGQLARLDSDELGEPPGIIASRIKQLKHLLQEKISLNQQADEFLTLSGKHALTRTEHRLKSEIGWHKALSAAIPQIVADETERRAPRA